MPRATVFPDRSLGPARVIGLHRHLCGVLGGVADSVCCLCCCECGTSGVLCERAFVANCTLIANSNGDDANPTTHKHAASNDIPVPMASRADTPLTSPTSVQTIATGTNTTPTLNMPRMARAQPQKPAVRPGGRRFSTKTCGSAIAQPRSRNEYSHLQAVRLPNFGMLLHIFARRAYGRLAA
jgi:hypothetical protein